MKYIGAVLLLLAALALCKLHTSYINERVKEHREYLSFLKHVRNRISCYLIPIKEAALGFSSERLMKNGFLSSLERGVSAKEAYEGRGRESLLSLEADRCLTELFSDFGSGYLDTEIKKLDFTTERLSAICEEQEKESKKKSKLVGTLVFAAAFSFIILIF